MVQESIRDFYFLKILLENLKMKVRRRDMRRGREGEEERRRDMRRREGGGSYSCVRSSA